MANLYITSTAQFKPFSFDEMLKPALMATQAHQAVEEAYNELDTQANAIGSLASETDDPITYARYKAYENSLRAQAEDLAANGLNPTSRQSMLNMRSRYAKEITPIKNAIERRRKLADAQMEAYMKNPTLMYQRNFNIRSKETSLDRFLEDPDYGYGDVASGALITQQAATQAGALAKKLSGISKGKLDAYTNTFIEQYGLSPGEIAAFNANPRDPKANRVLKAIYDNVYNTVPESIRNQYASDVNSYIGMGLYSAIGQDKLGTYENYGARQALQHAYRMAEIDYQNRQNLTGGFPLNPTPIISSRTNKEVNDAIKNYGHFFYKDKNGQLRMNQAGLKEYFRNPRAEGLKATIGKGGKEGGVSMRAAASLSSTTQFRQLMDSLGASKYIGMRGGKPYMQSGNLGNLWNQYYESGKRGKGMMRTEYITNINPEDQAGFKQRVLLAARAEGQLYETDMDDKKDKFSRTNKNNLSLEDLASDDYIITSRADSRYDGGRTLFILNKKTGETKRYESPAGIYTTAEDSSHNALVNMGYIEDALVSGKVNGKTITDTQRAKLENDYNYYSNQFGMINQQIGLDYSIPTQAGTPYTW